LHELATNAVKYGALREASGKLSISWRVEGHGQDRRLLIVWQESGVAMTPEPPKRRGFGSELIERALTQQLKAKTALEFGADGVRCSIEVPLLSPAGETAEA